MSIWPGAKRPVIPIAIRLQYTYDTSREKMVARIRRILRIRVAAADAGIIRDIAGVVGVPGGPRPVRAAFGGGVKSRRDREGNAV
jgi:hypothetical protein